MKTCAWGVGGRRQPLTDCYLFFLEARSTPGMTERRLNVLTFSLTFLVPNQTCLAGSRVDLR